MNLCITQVNMVNPTLVVDLVYQEIGSCRFNLWIQVDQCSGSGWIPVVDPIVRYNWIPVLDPGGSRLWIMVDHSIGSSWTTMVDPGGYKWWILVDSSVGSS